VEERVLSQPGQLPQLGRVFGHYAPMDPASSRRLNSKEPMRTPASRRPTPGLVLQ
jgi:hypothetical protein